MRYVIVGAGAVGGTIGGLLADSGHDVVLVARGAHADKLRADGLELRTPDRTITARTPVVSDVHELSLEPGDVLVLTVKSQDTAPLLTVLAARPVGGSDAGAITPVFCAQNGISNEPEALRRFAKVHGICVMLPATHLEPGVVEAQGTPLSALLEMGRFPTGHDSVDQAFADALGRSRMRGNIRDDVMAWKRAKLLRNVGNALDALCPDEPASTEALTALERGARAEAESCFAAAGLSVIGDPAWNANRGEQVNVGEIHGSQRRGGSTWQSLTRGVGSVETDYLNGDIVLLGRTLGIDVPVNALLQRAMAAAVRDGTAANSVDPRELLAELRRHTEA